MLEPQEETPENPDRVSDRGPERRVPAHGDLDSSDASPRRLALTVLLVWLGLFQHVHAQEFRAGTARAKITPEEAGWLGGYGHRNRPAEGVAADLWSRALALEDERGHRFVLANADIHIFTRRLHREIVEAAR